MTKYSGIGKKMSRSLLGFTLIEVIIAMSVLAIAVSVLLNVMANLTAESVYPEFLNTATYLAEGEMEKTAGLRFADITDQGPSVYPGDFSDYSYEIHVGPVPSGLGDDPDMEIYKQVQITVRHSKVGAVTLTTLVSNH